MPAIAVSAELKKRGATILFVGSRASQDRQLVEEADFAFRAIYTGKLRRYFAWRNFTDPFKVLFGFLQSLVLVQRFKPDVVFGKGGFVTVPVVRAARFWRIPVVLHESDVKPGLANRLGAGAAAKIAVSFPIEQIEGLPHEKLVYTGNPIERAALTAMAGRAQRSFKLNRKVPLVVVVGGSQGSVSLNDLIAASLPDLLKEVQVVHQVGEKSATSAMKTRQSIKPALRQRYHVRGYVANRDLFDLYAAADMIVARAGAGVLGGIAAAGKPSILIPLPAEVSDHQTYNAAYYADRGAALVLDQEQIDGVELARVIKQLLHNPQRRAEIGRNARHLATPEAASRVADVIEEIGNASV